MAGQRSSLCDIAGGFAISRTKTYFTTLLAKINSERNSTWQGRGHLYVILQAALQEAEQKPASLLLLLKLTTKETALSRS